MDYYEYQIQNAASLIGSLESVLAALALFAGMIAVGLWPKLRWVLLSGVMFLTTLGVHPYTGKILIPPIQQLRSYGRPLLVGLLVLLCVAGLRAARGWRSRVLLSGTLLFFLFQLLVCLRIGFGGQALRGGLSVLIYALMFIALPLGLSRALQTDQDVRRMLRAIVFGAALFVLGTLAQVAVDRSQVLWASRLFGLVGNAQHAAVILATTLGPACYLLTAPEEPKGYKILIAILIGFMSIMLVWTGSRTGFLIAVITLSLFFRVRLGRWAVALLVGGAFAVLAMQFLGSEATEQASRLLATDDTRTAAWRRMAMDFWANPLLGTPADEAAFSENSYLLVAARTGVVGLVPFLLALLAVALSTWRLFQLRRVFANGPFPSFVPIADLTFAGLVALFAGALFEGYFFSLFSYPLYLFFAYLALLAFLHDVAGYARTVQVEDMTSPQSPHPTDTPDAYAVPGIQF